MAPLTFASQIARAAHQPLRGMTPDLCTRLATKLHPIRWVLLASSLALVAGTWVSVFILVAHERVSLLTLIPIAGPPLAVLWAAVCCTFWFHPERGTLREDAPALQRVPGAARAGLRWYAAVFLACFVVVGVVGPLYILAAS
jgi:hypothetical protein